MNIEIINALDNLKKLNPEYQIYYFDDTEMEESLKENTLVYNSYLKIKPSAFKSDLWRYYMLYIYGGCYSDIGHVNLDSFDNICEKNKYVIVKETDNISIHNALICCVPNSEFMKKAIDLCVYNITNELYGVSDIDITGPRMLSRVNACALNKFDAFNETKILHHVVGKIPELNKIQFNGKVVVNTKFSNYYKIMYPDDKEDYHKLYLNKNVFKCF